jgi:hypothetical protein
MMGRLKSEQAQLFYQCQLDDAVPEDHLVRKLVRAYADAGVPAGVVTGVRCVNKRPRVRRRFTVWLT